ncbi:MAG: hypothetical protein KGL68_16455 [Burkholderiales bacterium]|nr:hypothetical protein [Burkholderiales bacterium]
MTRRTGPLLALLTLPLLLLAGSWLVLPASGAPGYRLQLLDLGADLVLLAGGCLLGGRFAWTLRSLEDVNRTLEQRLADRERQLAGNDERLFALEREQAAAQERQRIMRDLHDGLGSRLLVSLSRVERGEMSAGEVADALHGCIAEMRMALDTMAPQEPDFRSSLGNFLFRWRSELQACGLRLTWDIAAPDEALRLAPHASLQLLRIAQEALTNVVKHAGASTVHVRLHVVAGALALEVRDNGIGAAGVGEDSSGRGLTNMRTRAGQLGGRVDVHGGSGGTRVTLQVPLGSVTA